VQTALLLFSEIFQRSEPDHALMGNAVTATRFNRYGHIPCFERIHGALIALH
jgi:hypothetical protein